MFLPNNVPNLNENIGYINNNGYPMILKLKLTKLPHKENIKFCSSGYDSHI